MQIAIISDTHNDNYAIEKAIAEIQRREITHLVHCGDLTSRHTLQHYQGLQVHLSYGNGDLDQQGISETLKSLNHESSSGLIQDFSQDGQKFFVAHGDTPKLIHSALESGTYDWVLQGHTHRFKEEKYGKTRWINPGALGGRQTEEASFVVINTKTNSVERIFVKEL